MYGCLNELDAFSETILSLFSVFKSTNPLMKITELFFSRLQ